MATLYETHGHTTFVALYEHLGQPLPDVVRNAKPKKKAASHKFGECGAGPSKCTQHRREYRRDLEQRKALKKAAQRDKDRITAMHRVGGGS